MTVKFPFIVESRLTSFNYISLILVRFDLIQDRIDPSFFGKVIGRGRLLPAFRVEFVR